MDRPRQRDFRSTGQTGSQPSPEWRHTDWRVAVTGSPLFRGRRARAKSGPADFMWDRWLRITSYQAWQRRWTQLPELDGSSVCPLSDSAAQQQLEDALPRLGAHE